MNSIKVEDAKREEGFTLIELLVVVIIIGILAAIAIPVFLNQRERAWRSAVDSDLRNAAVAMEAAFTEDGAYPTDLATLTTQGYTETDGVTVAIGAAPNGTNSFCLTGDHENLGDPRINAIYLGGDLLATQQSGVTRETGTAGIACP